MFSLKLTNIGEFQLMQSSSKSSSGPGLLETSRICPGHPGSCLLRDVGSCSAVARTVWCQTALSNPVAAQRQRDIPQDLNLLQLLKLVELLKPEQLPRCWGLHVALITA